MRDWTGEYGPVVGAVVEDNELHKGHVVRARGKCDPGEVHEN